MADGGGSPVPAMLAGVPPRYRALLLDAAGTLLHPAEPIADSYARAARHHGLDIDAAAIAPRIGPSMHVARPLRRADPEWRAYWQAVVRHCTGSDDPRVLDDLLAYFRGPSAWTISPGAAQCCATLREHGIKLALVSNWDVHLRPLATVLGIDRWFDAILISAEQQLEKPDPQLFLRACARIGVEPAAVVHVGNDPDDDIAGARAAGCAAWLMGRDVTSFDALARQLVQANT